MDVNRLCMGCMEDKNGAVACPACGWQEGAVPENPNQLSPRRVLHDQYLLGRVLGQGGFGITYLGWDMHLERKVAIKEYFPHDFATRATGDKSTVSIYSGKAIEDFNYGLQKFLEEGKTLAKFQGHPGIVMVITFFRANSTGYLVMEYVDGMTFKDYLIHKGGKITFNTALNILIPVMDALREIHNANLLHRDISPDNIMISKSGQVKLLDFGAARYALNEHTRSLSVILKDGYAPEEQYRSKGKQGSWTDVYALAGTFYRAITGTVPPQALDRLAEDDLEPPSKLSPGIPPEAEKILMKALAVRAPDRMQSIGELQQQLMNQAGTSPQTASDQFTPPPVEPKSFAPTEKEPPYNPDEKTEAVNITELLEKQPAPPDAAPAPIDAPAPVNPTPVNMVTGKPQELPQRTQSGAIDLTPPAPSPPPPTAVQPTSAPPTAPSPTVTPPVTPSPPPPTAPPPPAASPPVPQPAAPQTTVPPTPAPQPTAPPPAAPQPAAPQPAPVQPTGTGQDGEINKPAPDAYKNDNNVWERQLVLEDAAIQLIYIPPGDFFMGASGIGDDSADDEKPRRRVSITKGFWMGKFPVTQFQWTRLVGSSPWLDQNMTAAGDFIPAVYVSWKDVQQFFARMRIRVPGAYRLPTEAEWEYACRAETDSAYGFGNDVNQLGNFAWYYDNAMAAGERFAHPVGQKYPNAWGLFDMHGNVNEWCLDYYSGQYVTGNPIADPKGSTMGSFRVCRGGSWLDIAKACRSAKRSNYKPTARRPDTGFRIVIEI